MCVCVCVSVCTHSEFAHGSEFGFCRVPAPRTVRSDVIFMVLPTRNEMLVIANGVFFLKLGLRLETRVHPDVIKPGFPNSGSLCSPSLHSRVDQLEGRTGADTEPRSCPNGWFVQHELVLGKGDGLPRRRQLAAVQMSKTYGAARPWLVYTDPVKYDDIPTCVVCGVLLRGSMPDGGEACACRNWIPGVRPDGLAT